MMRLCRVLQNDAENTDIAEEGIIAQEGMKALKTAEEGSMRGAMWRCHTKVSREEGGAEVVDASTKQQQVQTLRLFSAKRRANTKVWCVYCESAS